MTRALAHGFACAVVALIDPLILWALGVMFGYHAPGWAYVSLWVITWTVYLGPIPRSDW